MTSKFGIGQTIGIVLLARGGGAIAVVAVLILLSRVLPPSSVGIVLAAQAAAVLLAALATCNLEGVAIRLLPQRHQTAGVVRQFANATLKTAALGAPLAAIGAAGFFRLTSHHLGLTGPDYFAIALMVAMAAVQRNAGQWATGFGAVGTSAIWGLLLRPLLFFFVLLLYGLVETITLSAALWASTLTYGLAAIGPMWIVRRHIRESAPSEREANQTSPDQRWHREGLILVLSMVFLDRFPDVVTLLAGSLLPEADVARLAIALRFALILRMGMMAFSMALAPRVSAAIGTKDDARALRLVDGITLSMSAAGIAVAAVLIAAAPVLLSVFGPAYPDAAPLLRALVTAMVVPALLGPSLMVLVTQDRTQAGVRATLIGLAILVPGSIFGAVFGGVSGFACGIIAGQLAWAFSLAKAVRQSTGWDLRLPAAIGRQWQRTRPPKTGST